MIDLPKVNPLLIIGGIILVIMIGQNFDLGSQDLVADSEYKIDQLKFTRIANGQIQEELAGTGPPNTDFVYRVGMSGIIIDIDSVGDYSRIRQMMASSFPSDGTPLLFEDIQIGVISMLHSDSQEFNNICLNSDGIHPCEGGTCNTDADTNCDTLVSNPELLSYLSLWVDNQVSNPDLLTALSAWVNN